ncbi:small ribosomal subunit protein bS16m-like [Hydra vulgaris]|uniref:Small ribosomal subunit protein bS16m n=1 Tax=Hydra vulgaris TaxID=6087 RepID=A0ABM4DLU4_HYDVU
MKKPFSPVTTLRLAYYGCPNRPFFHIVATKQRIARNRGYYEQVGTFDPLPNTRNEKLISLNMDRIKYWLSLNCSMSKPVTRLLALAGVLPLDPYTLKLAEKNRQSKKNKEHADNKNTV